MNTRFFANDSVRMSAVMVRTLLRSGLLTALLLATAAWTQPAQAAAVADKARITLTSHAPTTPASGVIDIQPSAAITLSVAKKINGAGMPNEPVDWNVSGPGSAALTSTRSLTSAKDDTHEAGIASTDFNASKPGNYVVTARTQQNPGCIPAASCAIFLRAQFTLRIAGAAEDDSANDHRGRNLGIAAASVGAALAILANNNDRREQVLNRTLVIFSGNGQSGSPNAPLTAPLVVLAQNNSSPAPSIAINWSASGGATLSSATSVTNGSGQASITVTSLGSGPGQVTVTATRADDPSATVQFTLVVNTPGLNKISGDGQTAPTNTAVPNPLVVEATLNSASQPGISILWSVISGDATIAGVSNGGFTDASGKSSATIQFGPTPGPVQIRAARADNPSITQTFTLTSTLTRTLAIVSGDNQTAAPNTALPSPLVVRAQDNGLNAPGITINWTASGGAVLSSASSVTNGFGQASVTVTSTGPGPASVTVTATRADDPTATVQFHENIIPPVLSKTGGDNQTGAVGSVAPNPLQVTLVDGGGNPVAGQTIAWSVTSGSASLSSPTSTTNASGIATNTFTYGSTPGPITIHASAYSGSQSVDFSETAVTAASVQKTAGDNQIAAPGSTLPIPLTVHLVPPPGATGSMAGQRVTFLITSSTGGTLSVTSATTDASGNASTQLTFGLTPGVVTVVAQVPSGPIATFTETVSGSLVATSLTIVSGNQQVLTPGTASAPMVVELTQNGVPLPGMTINWATSSGSVSSATSVTDASGRASATVTISVAGPITVTATFNAFAQYTGSSVTFNHNSTLGSLSGLTDNGTSVAVALDNACAALSTLTNRTPEQQDLLNQCLAFNASSGVAPAAVTTAVEALLPSVSETQNKTIQAAIDAQFNNLKGRITSLRSGVGSGFGGLSFSNSSGVFPLGLAADSMLGLAANKSDQKKEIGADFSRWGVFASGNIGRGEGRAQVDSPGYKLDIKGVTVGVDYRQSDSLIFGAALGYTRQGTNLAGGAGSVNMSGFSLSGYSTWYQKSSWYVDGVITFSHNTFDHRRQIFFTLPLPEGGSTTVNQQAKASAGGDDSAATITFGRDFQKKAWSFGVYGRGEYSRQSFAGFTEKLDSSQAGSGLGLRIESRSVTAIGSVLGGKVTYAHSAAWGVLVPHFELEWQHEYRGNPDSFRVFFVDDPTGTPIAITGNTIDKDYFRVGLGSSFVFPKGRSGFVLYEKILGRSAQTQDTFSLGFRMEF